MTRVLLQHGRNCVGDRKRSTAWKMRKERRVRVFGGAGNGREERGGGN